MQYVNDDMDELFRRAAEEYPLDTNGSDWNKVSAALQNAEPGPVPKDRDNRHFLWLLLLLPLGLICNKLYTPSASLKSNGTGAALERSVATDHTITENRKVSKGDNISNSEDVAVEPKRPSFDNIASGTSSFQSPHIFSTKATYGVSTMRMQAPGFQNTAAGDPQEDYFTGRSFTRSFPFTALIKNAGTPIGLKEPTPAVNDPAGPDRRPTPKKEKKFYGGLMAGIDATTIKFQKVENKGYDFGAIVGYQLNPKWSIEAGVFSDKKFYYTEGKYFNTYKVYVPSNSKITDVSGNCSMTEVPLNVKYNITTAKRSTWFVAAGASSYFMTQEDYHYTYYYPSTNTSSVYFKEYKNSPKSLFSVAHLSGGYTHSIGKIADLRIEPYLKIPLAGMGVGKLPLFSAGLHVGITKKF